MLYHLLLQAWFIKPQHSFLCVWRNTQCWYESLYHLRLSRVSIPLDSDGHFQSHLVGQHLHNMHPGSLQLKHDSVVRLLLMLLMYSVWFLLLLICPLLFLRSIYIAPRSRTHQFILVKQGSNVSMEKSSFLYLAISFSLLSFFHEDFRNDPTCESIWFLDDQVACCWRRPSSRIDLYSTFVKRWNDGRTGNLCRIHKHHFVLITF